MKAKKKPVIIDFISVELDKYTFLLNLKEWVESFGDNFTNCFELDKDGNILKVKTLEGTSYEVSNNDNIIRGIKGEYYPCKKDVFEQTYDVI